MNNVAIEKLPARKWLFLGFVFSLVFLCYGSFVPLDYEYRPLGEAWSSFVAVISEGFHFKSRTDLGENFLLMVPAGFFGMGAAWINKKSKWIIPLAVALWLVCVLFSFTVEFAQVFFRGRTPAFSDILMQTMGAFAGITIWTLWGYKIWAYYFRSTKNEKATNHIAKILWAYLLVLIVYSIVPFDVTISPYSIYQRYKAGRIILIPFSFNYGHWAEFIYSVVTDVLIWLPVGFLWSLMKIKRMTEACLWTLSAVIIVEVSQIFISSRIFDVTDIILGSIGGIAGVCLALKMPLGTHAPLVLTVRSSSEYKLTWIGLALYFIWLVFLALIFWFPYDVLIERKFIESQLNRFFQVPFHVYYYSGGLSALTSVLRKTLFFVPLGFCVSIACRPLQRFGVDSLLFLIAFFSFFAAGAVIELGQVFIPGKLPDSTDLLFETIGGICGFCIINYYIKRFDCLNVR